MKQLLMYSRQMGLSLCLFNVLCAKNIKISYHLIIACYKLLLPEFFPPITASELPYRFIHQQVTFISVEFNLLFWICTSSYNSISPFSCHINLNSPWFAPPSPCRILTSNKWQDQEFHPPPLIHMHAAVLNQLSTGTTRPFFTSSPK
jgi:hypothetical protein